MSEATKSCVFVDLGLQRYVHIDIDDVFVAPRGTRMTSADVEVGCGA